VTDHLRVAVTGPTGLLGTHLREHLADLGHQVHQVVRRRELATGGDIYYSPSAGEIDAHGFQGVDVVVHLAGHPIGGERWTDEVRRKIRDSRVQGTSLLAEALASLDAPPTVLVSASAVGYYGDRGDEILTESSRPGGDFLAEVCVAWEAAAEPARAAGIRVVHPRTGIVLGQGAPLIEKIELPFKLGVGGRIGDGRTWYPWIALEDEIRALWFCATSELSGGVNLTSPNPVRNAELTKALGEAMRRPTMFPVPALALRALYGQMGVTLATTSGRALPEKLLEAGFQFRYRYVREALQAVFG